ncbi:MAG: TIGR04255 family protein [Candidatus Magasanikiibacteriota bacterium]
MSNKYNKNFIGKVAFRLDFSENVAIGSLKDLHEEINDVFSIKEEKESVTGFVQLDFKSGEMRNETEKMASWLFSNTEKNKRMEINSRFLYLEYDKYNEKTELFDDIKNVVQKFISKYNIKTFNRIGLRFINEIKLQESEQLDWTKYIDKNLIANLIFVKDQNKKLARAMSALVFKEEKGDINFNFGIWNSEYPNEVNRKEFVLDYDCFSNLGISDDEVLERTEQFHSYIEKLFEASITEEFRGLLNK